MFKKAVEAKSHQRLSGADRKKLKRTLKDKFPRASDADMDVLLPPKAQISVAKLQTRVLVYSVEGDFPVFFDIDGRGTEIYPTDTGLSEKRIKQISFPWFFFKRQCCISTLQIFALWRVPELLPSFMLKGGEVSRFILGGADLMLPGISVLAEGLPPFRAGEAWAVKVPGNPAPIAVGSTTMSSAEAMKAGLRGKALRITHYYRDSLWESVEGHFVPNAGFMEDIVIHDPAVALTAQDADSAEAFDEQNYYGSKEAGELAGATDTLDSHPSSSKETSNSHVEQINAEVSNLKVSDINDDESTSEQQRTLSADEVDSLLDKCLLQALHTTVKDKDLPIPGSTLWSNHVLPCRPSGITLDIKKSTHKKLSKWLQTKCSIGLQLERCCPSGECSFCFHKQLSGKEDKYKKETVLIAINRNHPDYTSFRPEKRQEQQIEHPENQITSGSNSQKTLEVVEIYKSSSHVNPIFASVGADTGKLYSGSEASDVVFKYVEKENLVKPTDKSTVVLDAILCDALFKGAIKKGSTYPTVIHKKDLGSTFVGRMQPHHMVIRDGESVVRKGGLKTVQILTERRQGNKKVTKLSGVETFLIDPESLASELQKKFACSTSVGELPGKKGLEVMIQGGKIDDVARLLVEQYGIPKRYIEEGSNL
ncbi:Eukaryotic translation initiation factor 2D [Linum perenne]